MTLTRGTPPGVAGSHWILAESKSLRLSTLFVLYIAQGVPLGLFWFAIPAWMAANGARAPDVGYVLGLTALPWTLKLVNGFIMDRYTFLAMGRRRIWIIGAQIAMIVLLVSCAVIGPGATDISLLGFAGFVVNMAATFQDVAVDGMAVDIVEEGERARASGMMFGGQAIGIAASTAFSGIAIARLGPSAAYLLSAGIIGVITLQMLLLRERTGERLVPWSAGGVHSRNRDIHVGAWWPILRSTVVSMMRPVSLLWLPVLLVRGFHYGMFTAVTPLIGTGNVGWSEIHVTGVTGTAQLVAGILGLTVGGWLGDTFGAKRATIVMFAALMVVSAAMWFGVANWGDPAYFTAFVYAWYGLDVLITVVALPISMRLCDPRVAATQFTLYMATSNFGISIAALVLGSSSRLGGLPMMFVVVFALHLVGLMLVVLVRFHRKTAEDEVAGRLAGHEGPEPVIN